MFCLPCCCFFCRMILLLCVTLKLTMDLKGSVSPSGHGWFQSPRSPKRANWMGVQVVVLYRLPKATHLHRGLSKAAECILLYVWISLYNLSKLEPFGSGVREVETLLSGQFFPKWPWLLGGDLIMWTSCFLAICLHLACRNGNGGYPTESLQLQCCHYCLRERQWVAAGAEFIWCNDYHEN